MSNLPRPNFSIEELKKVLARKKLDTAPGPDAIPYSAYRTLNEDNLSAILEEINSKINDTPEEWLEALQWNIFKEGKKEELNNYRPIALCNTIYKIQTLLIKERMEEITTEENLIHPSQHGFTKHRTTSHNIIALKTIIHKDKLEQRETHLLFLDIAGAYDSVPHEALWCTLAKNPSIQPYAMIIQQMYSKATTQIITSVGLTDKIQIERGVRQGDPLSPLLFNLFINEVITKVYKQHRGWRTKNQNYPTLAFADDLVLCANTRRDLQTITKKVIRFLRKNHMNINTKKTIYTSSNRRRRSIHLQHNTKIKEVKKGKAVRYLGAYLSLDQPDKKESDTRIAELWKRVNLITSKKLYPHIMAEAVNALAYSKIVYSFGHTKYKRKALKEIDKKVAHLIRTKTGAYPFHTDKVHAKWREGGWGLLSLHDLYTRMMTGTLFDRILNRPNTISKKIICEALEEIGESNKEIPGSITYQALHAPPTIKQAWKIAREEGLIPINTTLNLLHPETILSAHPLVIDELNQKGISDVTTIKTNLPQSVANYLLGPINNLLPFMRRDQEMQPPQNTIQIENSRVVWTDGSLKKGENSGTAGIFYDLGNPGNKTIHIPHCNSSFEAEAIAIHAALRECPQEENIRIITDSLSVIQAINSEDSPSYVIEGIKKRIQERKGKQSRTEIIHIYSHIKKKKKKSQVWEEKIRDQEIELFPHFRQYRWGNKKADKLTNQEASKQKGIPPYAPEFMIFNKQKLKWEPLRVKDTLKREQRSKIITTTNERDQGRHPSLQQTNRSLSEIALKNPTIQASEANFLIKARSYCLPIPDRKNKPAICPKCGGLETHQHLLLECPNLEETKKQIVKKMKETLTKMAIPHIVANEWFNNEIPTYMWALGYIPKKWAQRMKRMIGGKPLTSAIAIATRITSKLTLKSFKENRNQIRRPNRRANQRNTNPTRNDTDNASDNDNTQVANATNVNVALQIDIRQAILDALEILPDPIIPTTPSLHRTTPQ